MGFDEKKNADGKYDQGVWRCYDWPNWTWGRKYARPEFYRYFDPEHWTEEATFFVSQRYTQGSRYYPLPAWVSAYKDILTEIELVSFKYWSVARAFAPAGIIRVMGRTQDKEVQAFKQQVEDLGGSINAGKLMMIINDSADQQGSTPPVDFIPFNNNPASADVTSYLEQGRQAIVTAHGLASATVVGINVATGLQSDAATLALGLHELKRSVMKDQNHIVSNVRRLLQACGFPNPQFEIVQSLPNDDVFSSQRMAAFRSSHFNRISR